ncbi:MAG: hypothetical protein J5865_07085 [Lachnospiraceae bacterium]|nr:hypothetical protein [Lachnospiraceae bacterium]
MKLIKKLYWIAIVVLMVAGFPYEGIGEFITTLSYYVFFGLIFLYAAPKVLRIGSSAKRGGYRMGDFRNSVIGGMQQSVSGAVTNLMMGSGNSSHGTGGQTRKQQADQQAYANWQAANQQAYNRWQAGNEAIFHENQARKNAGTYRGYQAANRAKDARNRARQ